MLCNITHDCCTHLYASVRTFYGVYANCIKIGIHTQKIGDTLWGVAYFSIRTNTKGFEGGEPRTGGSALPYGNWI